MLKINFRLFQNVFQIGRQLSNIAVVSPRKNISAPLCVAWEKLDVKPPRPIAVPLSVPQYRIPKPAIEDIPIIPKIIESPRDAMLSEIREIIRNRRLIIPAVPGKQNEIQAARLIVIRRRKMKKHKLRKLRKKMKYEWAKVRQRREMRKEKSFQAELISQIKEAEKFSAEAYVAEKLRLANETPIPRFWNGKRLPQFIIKEKLGIK